MVGRVSLNEERRCLTCASERGYGIYLSVPLERYCWRSFAGGGFSFAELFGQSRVLALVGGRPSPCGFSESSIVLWDDESSRRLWELKLFSPIVGVITRRGFLAAVLENKLVLYRIAHDFSWVRLERSLETLANPSGICTMSSPTTLSASSGEVSLPASRGSRPEEDRWFVVTHDDAHKHPIAHLALNRDGSYLASASRSGELIRLWGTQQGTSLVLMRELRRGSTAAAIYSISFSAKSDILCCSSDSGTVHLFSLQPAQSSLHARSNSYLMQVNRSRPLVPPDWFLAGRELCAKWTERFCTGGVSCTRIFTCLLTFLLHFRRR
ncbi:hypothetical protein GUITHDRAFT_90449 [Guillardia theta CCMP2712]|uniref:Uncharacterized protein n=1 Tax=Guillardia theta (strain CCMP2712) TaxID=905079 RepID=L1IFH5_GUITC|nr:hypothetical protein GUITHDRAFT_90449 [Guillardia theta CCMP2712]EKX34605.1 hypothetical protein GUITHDRAFT_90449 [Guillardia theta CCMP2712]|eukprot:XP_005821585.1 hypothetical protein GUITHDRAFT_90449 [Guillardia theta CCMP2712]